MCREEFCHKRLDLRLERRFPHLKRIITLLNCKCAIEGDAKYNDVRYVLQRKMNVLAVATAFSGLSISFVVLRLYTRFAVIHRAGKDDYAIMVSLVSSMPIPATLNIILIHSSADVCDKFILNAGIRWVAACSLQSRYSYLCDRDTLWRWKAEDDT
jgi:hypothetical protein